MKIRIIGKSGKHNSEYLDLYDGIDCQSEFTEYFDTDEQPLIDKGVTEGWKNPDPAWLPHLIDFGLIEATTNISYEIK